MFNLQTADLQALTPPVAARVLTNPALLREWCAMTGHPFPDLNGRMRAVREDNLISTGPHGPGAPPATLRDAGVLTLAPLVASMWKDVPAGIRRYGALVGDRVDVNEYFTQRFGEEICRALDTGFKGRNLLDAVMLCLATCRSWSEMRVLSLRVERSDYLPMAWLQLGASPAEAAIRFAEPDSPRQGVQPEPVVGGDRMRGFALHAMAELIAPNLRPRNDTGPSVPPDEPGLPDAGENFQGPHSNADPGSSTTDEAPRATTPATTSDRLEVKAGLIFNQSLGFDLGAPSGGFPLSPKESPDADRPPVTDPPRPRRRRRSG
jgi:hypothetical protein